jgi:hypothetical protein
MSWTCEETPCRSNWVISYIRIHTNCCVSCSATKYIDIMKLEGICCRLFVYILCACLMPWFWEGLWSERKSWSKCKSCEGNTIITRWLPRERIATVIIRVFLVIKLQVCVLSSFITGLFYFVGSTGRIIHVCYDWTAISVLRNWNISVSYNHFTPLGLCVVMFMKLALCANHR